MCYSVQDHRGVMGTWEILVVRRKSLQAWKLGWEPSATHRIESGLACLRRDLLSINCEAGSVPGSVDTGADKAQDGLHALAYLFVYCWGVGGLAWYQGGTLPLSRTLSPFLSLHF